MAVRERLFASITDIRARGQRLAELNRELLTAELKKKGGRAGAAAGLFAGAALLAVYAVGFALATITVALDLVLPLWLSLLIVTAALILIIAILALVGRSQAQKAAKEPITAQAEAKATAELMKAKASETVAAVRGRFARLPSSRSPSTSRAGSASVPESPVAEAEPAAAPSGRGTEGS